MPKSRLFKAIESQKNDAVKKLLEQGEDPNIDCDGRSLLRTALFLGDREIVELLLKFGAKANPKTDNLLTSCKTPELIKLMVNSGAKVDFRPKSIAGIAPIHYFAGNGCPALLKALLECRAKVDLLHDEGNTALHLAVFHQGKLESVEVLLEYGASPNLKNKDGFTPLHKAASGDGKNAPKMILALLKAGADVDPKSLTGTTPLMLAARSRNPENLNYLLKAGANIHVASSLGFTALGSSVLGENVAGIERLLEAGASTSCMLRSKPLLDYIANESPKKVRKLFGLK
jgi:ankyrin repeat protein